MSVSRNGTHGRFRGGDHAQHCVAAGRGMRALVGLELSAAITDEAYRGILKVKDRGGI